MLVTVYSSWPQYALHKYSIFKHTLCYDFIYYKTKFEIKFLFVVYITCYIPAKTYSKVLVPELNLTI